MARKTGGRERRRHPRAVSKVNAVWCWAASIRAMPDTEKGGYSQYYERLVACIDVHRFHG
ncbi:hypothetical protein [Collinsella tanakaei]|uniref:hypothetical protein n=1 Tax=Collinsella tanakaei TaxID=626935 RepID=UPI0025A3541D|nr:hypothetical protein [Collinsella tanakaei]MDM8301665.1 hypothetical protein [Collinsella tanakaei]